MSKIAITLLALAALSTTALANDNRDGRGYQDTLGMFTVQGANFPGTKVSDVMIRKHKGLSEISPMQLARLVEKNNDMGSSY